MGSPEKPIDVEMGDMDETHRLNPDVEVKDSDKTEKEPTRFTGLKKDELLEVSSRKEWVVARWILFVVFWLAWIAMLVGAIIIVVKAPRCKDKPTPPWFQDTTIYEVDVTKFDKDVNGVAKHLDYIRLLKSKTVIVAGLNDADDLGKPLNETDFKNLVSKAASDDNDKNLKIVVDLKIDSLTTNSGEFVASTASNCSSDSTGQYCSMFHWQDNATNTSSEYWLRSDSRNQFYKAVDNVGSAAYLDFSTQEAVDYITGIVKKWIGYGADGFQLGDFAMIGADRSQRTALVKAVLNAFNETQTGSDAKKVIGLYLYSSDVSSQTSLFPDDKDMKDKAAVVINTGLYGLKDASAITKAITDWRNATEPFTSSYVFNTMTQNLLTTSFGKDLAAGYTLLSYCLPGVPFVRSGDEALLMDDSFIWEMYDEWKIMIPQNASTGNIEVIKNVADLRVNQYRSMESLRWDHNEDSLFAFVETNSTDVVAFSRKWDKKKMAFTIFNPTDQVVYVKVPGEAYGAAEILGYTGSSYKEGASVVLKDGVKIDAGATLVVRIK